MKGNVQKRQWMMTEKKYSIRFGVQQAYILKNVTLKPKARERKRKHDENNISRRKRENTGIYSMHIPSINERIEVCQKFFLNKLSIDGRRIRTALGKCNEAGVLEVDKRGSHSHHYTAADQEELSIEHIKLLKVVESHYVRKTVKYEYLPEELSVSMMHQMYTEWCAENRYEVETYNFYNKVFREKFNLKDNWS